MSPMGVAGAQGLNEAQAQLQVGLWAMFAAPLLLSADLRNISAAARATLQNQGAIIINQDPLGERPAARAVRGYVQSEDDSSPC